MKTTVLSLPVILVFTFISCSTPMPKAPPMRIVQNKSLVIGNPLDCGLDNMQIFPVGCNYKPEIYQDEKLISEQSTSDLTFTVNVTANYYDTHASTEYVNSSLNENDIRNILFYDLNTGKSYPLVTDTLHILSFALHNELKTPLIFYRVVENDFNKDSLFNDNDPVMLLVSDLNGKNLVRVTPGNEQFTDYFYYEKTQKILVKTVVDGNKDGFFTERDETNFREVSLAAPAMGREIFSKSLKDSLRTM